MLVVITLDPWNAQEGTTALDLPALGLDWGDGFTVHDEITGGTWQWGQYNYVRLEPWHHVAHIFRIVRWRYWARTVARRPVAASTGRSRQPCCIGGGHRVESPPVVAQSAGSRAARVRCCAAASALDEAAFVRPARSRHPPRPRSRRVT